MRKQTRTLLGTLSLLAASGLGIWGANAASQSDVAQAALLSNPSATGAQFGVQAPLAQNGSVRRESGLTLPDGKPPRTGPASAFQPLVDPVFGPNYRANTDTQSPNLAQQEPSIAVNPTNPLNVVAMAKDERSGSNTKQTWIYTSTDGGVTWVNQIFPFLTQSPFSSDPIVNFSDDGICYVTSLPYGGGSNDGIQVARSMDGGITFTPAVHLPGTNGSSDKEWTWIDNNPGSPFYHRVYTAWMDFGTGNGWRLNYSSDRGVTFSSASGFTNANQFPMPVALPNGDVIVSYLVSGSAIGYRRSTDGGVTFSTVQTISSYTGAHCPPDNSGCGVWRLNTIPTNSVNRTNGTMVVVWADGRASPNSTSTIYYTRSTDNGVTWSPAAILAPPGVTNTYQIEPWIEADEVGNFHAIWYDDRENANSSIFNIYYSQSTDNGVTWSTATRISTATTDLRIGIPSSYNLAAGDYINVTASHGNVYGVWTDTRSGTGEDIYVVHGVYGGGTPTATVTGTPPTATRTSTATNTVPTATATQTVCATSYQIATATGTIVPGTTNTGSACDDCDTAVTIPFNYQLYGQSFSSVNLSSNGKAEFLTVNESGGYSNSCLPAADNLGPYDYTIFAYWDDQLTTGTCTGGCGIYTSVSGSAPNRIFNIEWRTTYFSGGGTANYELRLYEGQSKFDIVYGAVTQGNTSATSGVQRSTTNFTQYFCNGSGGAPTAGLVVTYTQTTCGSPLPTGTATSILPTFTTTSTTTSTPIASSTVTTVASATRTNTSVVGTGTATSILPTLTSTVAASATRTTTVAPTNTPGGPTETSTSTVVASASAVASATSTVCPLSFTDVPVDSTFYPFIRCLACRGIISGYNDGTFRPNNDITRGQIAKMVSNAAGFQEDPGPQLYEDVDQTNTFYVWINRLSNRGIMGGYPCGTIGPEPCISPANLPYFRPFANATRGQLAKIVSNAAQVGGSPTDLYYTDVPQDNPFYLWIMRLTNIGVMSGYPCGGPNEPCDDQQRPYFRPFANVTRGQASKIVANTFLPGCETPAQRP